MGQCTSIDLDPSDHVDVSEDEMLKLCGCDECRGLKPHGASSPDERLGASAALLRSPTSTMLRLHVIEPEHGVGASPRGFRVELDAHQPVDSLHKLIMAFLSIAGRCPDAFELWHGEWRLDPQLTLLEAGLCRDSPIRVSPIEPEGEPGCS